MKLNFPDRDLHLHMEGGHCVYTDNKGTTRYCRLTEVTDDRAGRLLDIETGGHLLVKDVFADTIDWSWPELGLRNVGGAAVCLGRHPAAQYRRTIKSNNVIQQVITPNGIADHNPRESQLFSKAAISELFRPTYPDSLGHVRWAVNTGKVVSVALSHALAVTAVDDDTTDDLQLFYRTIPVGVLVGDDLTLTLNPSVRDSKVGKRAVKLYQEWRACHERNDSC